MALPAGSSQTGCRDPLGVATCGSIWMATVAAHVAAPRRYLGATVLQELHPSSGERWYSGWKVPVHLRGDGCQSLASCSLEFVAVASWDTLHQRSCREHPGRILGWVERHQGPDSVHRPELESRADALVMRDRAEAAVGGRAAPAST